MINDFFYLFIFSNLWCFSSSFTVRFNHILVIDCVYGGINLLKYFHILARNIRTDCRIISLKF